MLPNFFVIGAAKAGTTSLHEYLAAHPQIQMSAVKEPNYFAPDDRSAAGRRHSPVIRDRDRYEALFDPAAALRGESSPAYSQYPRRPGVPERIHELVPEARFIYLVRDPIERIRSFYMQRASLGDYPPFAEALGDIDDPANDYICPSRYRTQADRYVAVFGRDRLLVVDQRDLRDDRAASLGRIFDFLGADPAGFWDRSYEREANRGDQKRRYTPAYARLSRSPLARAAHGALPERLRRTIASSGRRALKRPLEAPGVEPGLHARLTEILAPEAEGLRELTGQRFETWSV